MKKLLLKLYQIIIAPIRNRMYRDVALQLQNISLAYIEQHERISTKMIDEITSLSMRLDKLEKALATKELTEGNTAPVIEQVNR